MEHLSFKEVKNFLLQEIRGQFATDSYAKQNLRLIILPEIAPKNLLLLKQAGSASNDASITNAINSLSINGNEDTKHIDACVTNSFRGCNDDDLSTSSKHRNNNVNDDSNPQANNDNESNDIDEHVINSFRSFKNNRNNNS